MRDAAAQDVIDRGFRGEVSLKQGYLIRQLQVATFKPNGARVEMNLPPTLVRQKIDLISDTLNKNTDCMVALFVARNPGVPWDEIEIVHCAEPGGGTRIYVRRREP